MLKKTLATAVPFAQELSAQGFQLRMGAWSHLAQLMVSASPDVAKPVAEKDDFVNSVEMVVCDPSNATDYDVVNGSLQDELKNLVLPHVKMAQRIGQVAVGLKEEVQKYLENTPEVSASEAFNIRKDDLPTLFGYPSVAGTLNDDRTYQVRLKGDNIVNGQRSQSQILEMLLGKDTELNGCLEEAACKFSPLFLEDIWHQLVYAGQSDAARSIATVMGRPPAERATFFLLGSLIADHLLQNVPQDAAGSLAQYEAAVADLLSFCKGAAGVAYREFESACKNKVLVASYRNYEHTVIVNGPVWDDWLASGKGSPELVLGSMLHSGRAFNVQDFDANAGDYLSAWEKHCTFFNAGQDSRRAELLRSLWMSCFASQLNTVEDFEADYRKEHPAHADQCVNLARDKVSMMSLNELRDGRGMALCLVAGIRFSYTPAYQFLKDIDEARASDVREAALIATAKYMARYLVSQMTVVRTK